jgi:CheY-like chemotaxis protein
MSSSAVLILIIDDEPAIREILQHALEDAGFAVLAASTGNEAMALVASRGQEFRALITDINLPGEVTGWDIAHHARAALPLLPIVYMSGASLHEWRANGVPESVMVAKPFALAQVVTAVSQLITAASTAAAGIAATLAADSDSPPLLDQD